MRFSQLNPELALRLLAGTFVLIGTTLAWLVSPWWLLLPAFVGFNLVQSVFTGFCPALIMLGLLPWRNVKTAFSPAPRIPQAEAADRVRRGVAVLVDVREASEWAKGVVNGATLLSLSDLTGKRSQWRPFLSTIKGREIICYCAAGGRAGTAASLLQAEGFKAANSGGLSDWAAGGWYISQPNQ